jgi:hypothetical protein
MKQRRLILPVIGLLLLCSGKSFGSSNLLSPDFFSPRTFALSWTGMPEMTTIKWDGKSLIYENHRPGKTNEAKIIPSQAAWTNFWVAMDQIKIWDWQSRYINRDVTDGLAWEVELEHGTKKVHVFGLNGYPRDGSPGASSDTPSKLFAGYQGAVEELIGRKLWPEEEALRDVVGRWEGPAGASPMVFAQDGTCEASFGGAKDGTYTMIGGTYTVSAEGKITLVAKGGGAELTEYYFFEGDRLTDGIFFNGEGKRYWRKVHQ